jgi:gliding-associated putative ABC transporter substrate-binding component GldG
MSLSNWIKGKKTGDWLLLANILVLIALTNLMASRYFFRIDLTEEKRYTIKAPTKQLLQELEDEVFIEVFLEGDLNPGFKRFQKSIRETLNEFRIYSNNKVQFVFTDPAQAASEKAKNEFMGELSSKGISGMRVIDNKEGERLEKVVFPGALVSSNGFESGVMLLKGNRGRSSQEVLNQSIEGVEFELANAISKLSAIQRKKVGFLTGHGELDSLEIASLNNALLEKYDVVKVNLQRKTVLSGYDALILAKPRRPFSEQDKFKMDQYLMKGGKLLMLLDKFDASMDSASLDNYFASSIDTKLDDQLFKYGIRINSEIVQDRAAAKYPIVIGKVGNQPEIMQMEWPFFPLLNHYAEHPITRNLDATLTRFVSSMDTVKALGVKKTPLLMTSAYSRKLGTPVKIGVDDLRKTAPENFNAGEISVGYLLEGRFNSLYANRFLPSGVDSTSYISQSLPTKLIVIADGDVARNDINPRTKEPQVLGTDVFSGYTYANQDLLLNMISYLTDDHGLINARSKEIKIRPLDKEKVKNDRLFWQTINLIVPLLILILFGVVRALFRRRKYASY